MDNQWFVEAYDRVVLGSADEGTEVEKSRDAVAHAYADAIESGAEERWRMDLVQEGRLLFDREVGNVRTRRRRGLKHDAEYIVDALSDGTILGADDPVLAQAYPLGNGSDKTLGLWAVPDWLGAIRERYAGAEERMVAAREFAVPSQKVIEALAEREARTTWQLFRT